MKNSHVPVFDIYHEARESQRATQAYSTHTVSAKKINSIEWLHQRIPDCGLRCIMGLICQIVTYVEAYIIPLIIESIVNV